MKRVAITVNDTVAVNLTLSDTDKRLARRFVDSDGSIELLFNDDLTFHRALFPDEFSFIPEPERHWRLTCMIARAKALLAFLDEKTASRVMTAHAEVERNLPPQPPRKRGPEPDRKRMAKLHAVELLADPGQTEALVSEAFHTKDVRQVNTAMRKRQRMRKPRQGPGD
jgi:hypothetical protein